MKRPAAVFHGAMRPLQNSTFPMSSRLSDTGFVCVTCVFVPSRLEHYTKYQFWKFDVQPSKRHFTEAVSYTHLTLPTKA